MQCSAVQCRDQSGRTYESGGGSPRAAAAANCTASSPESARFEGDIGEGSSRPKSRWNPNCCRVAFPAPKALELCRSDSYMTKEPELGLIERRGAKMSYTLQCRPNCTTKKPIPYAYDTTRGNFLRVQQVRFGLRKLFRTWTSLPIRPCASVRSGKQLPTPSHPIDRRVHHDPP